jgi:hypothetical protein
MQEPKIAFDWRLAQAGSGRALIEHVGAARARARLPLTWGFYSQV